MNVKIEYFSIFGMKKYLNVCGTKHKLVRILPLFTVQLTQRMKPYDIEKSSEWNWPQLQEQTYSDAIGDLKLKWIDLKED